MITTRTREEAFERPKPGDEWHGPKCKVLVLEVNDVLEGEPSVRICGGGINHPFNRNFAHNRSLKRFQAFLGDATFVGNIAAIDAVLKEQENS